MILENTFIMEKFQSYIKVERIPRYLALIVIKLWLVIFFLIYILPYPILLIILNSVSISNINGYLKTIQYMIIPKKIAVA